MEKVNFHKYAWECPVCKNYKRIKGSYKDIRIARCCGVKVEISSGRVPVYSSELQITDVKRLP